MLNVTGKSYTVCCLRVMMLWKYKYNYTTVATMNDKLVAEDLTMLKINKT